MLCEKKYLSLRRQKMVGVAQLVRVADCGSVGRGFESHHPPQKFLNNFFLKFQIIEYESNCN